VRTDVPLAALARIDDPDALQALANDPGAQKAVRKRARSLLEATLTDDHPIRVAERRERQRQLCLTVESLSNDAADPAAALTALHQAKSEWEELSARGAPDPELEDRFRQASDSVGTELARAEERAAQRRAREAERLQTDTARRRLCETVEGLEGQHTPARLQAARAAWEALPSSDDPGIHDLVSRFALAIEHCEERYQRWRLRDAFRARLETLVLAAEALIEKGNPRAAAAPRARLEKRWAGVAASAEGKRWLSSEAALQRRFAEAGEALNRQEKETEHRRGKRERQGRSEVKTLCARLEQLAKAEHFKHTAAERALEAAATTLQHFPPLPASERQALRQRLTTAHETLSQRTQQDAVAEDWKRWANAEVQENLIAQAEALLAANDPGDMLRQLGRLENEWKRFASARQDRSQELWDRFRNARNALRQRCHAFLAENLEKKKALCDAVEQLAESTDWNATAAEIQRLQAEWKQIGPVRKHLSAALFDRFRAPANRFFERRKEVMAARKERRDAMLERMRSLCETAEAVADSTDWETTATEIKRLQGEARTLWRRPRLPASPQGATPRPGDALQDRFRAACDRFFDRYRRRDDVEREGNVEAAEQILTDLDTLRASLAGAEPPTADVATQRLKEALEAWGRVGPLPSARVAGLRRRLQAACDSGEAACPQGLLEAELAAQTALVQREKLCTRLERMAASLAAEKDEAPQTDLGERLKLALAANTIGGAAATPREKALREARETAERLRARWQRMGPIIGDRGRTLAQRFDKALADVETRCAPEPETSKPAPS
jgi:hypothetical protein